MIVLDSSALVKLVLEEPRSAQARKIVMEAVREGEKILIPDIALAEALNALWKHHLIIGDLSLNQLESSAEDLLAIWRNLTVQPTVQIAKPALKIALENRITIYDALYLALAKKQGSRLLTFDERLREKAEEINIPTIPQT